MKEKTEKTKILAVCTGNRCRSKTLAGMLNATPGCEARSAGTNPILAGRSITEEDLRWAGHVIVFEEYHVQCIRSRFSKLAKKLDIINLDIEDRYAPFDPVLIELLKDNVAQRLGLALSVPDNASALYQEDLKENGPFYPSSWW